MKQSFLKAKKHSQSPVQYKHDLGQNFLYDAGLLKRLVAMTGIEATEDVLEIGAGEGTLTEQLCVSAHTVVSVEVDHDLIPLLHLMEERLPGLHIVEGDIRKLSYEETVAPLQKPYHVIANIPYNITSPILDLLWKHHGEISQIALMVQKEVAEKLTALPKDELYGLPSVTCGYYAEATIAEIIPKEMFTPSPKVDSAFVILKPHASPLLPAEQEKLFFSIAKSGFALRRKTLANALKSNPASAFVLPALEKLGFQSTVRAEELTVADWLRLTQIITELQEEHPS